MKALTFVVDLDRCIGCKGCQVACKMANKVALGACRNPVKIVGPTGTYPDVQMYYLPAMCQQCANPPCVTACPTGACYRDPEEGIILIDQNMCIGCQSCSNSCPYGATAFNKEMRVMGKCDTCLDRRKSGEIPACVRNCSGGALHVGYLADPESEASVLLREAGEDDVHSMRDFGNNPTARYILRKAAWLDLLPRECNDVRRGKR